MKALDILIRIVKYLFREKGAAMQKCCNLPGNRVGGDTALQKDETTVRNIYKKHVVKLKI